jgi:methylase of polypeptide subunit release factors
LPLDPPENTVSTPPTTLEAQDENGALIAHPFEALRTIDGLGAVGWRSEAGLPPPKRVVLVDDTLTADIAYRLACEGTALFWRGDFQNAKMLLQAMARRADQEKRRPRKPKEPVEVSKTEIFNRYRLAKSQRARTLGMLLIPFDAGHGIPLRRAPDVVEACEAAYGAAPEPYVASLRELLGIIGAHEWQKKGVEVPALGSRIFPHYGVFAPVRSEYVQLVADAPFPTVGLPTLAFDIGTGTGVLALVLARRGAERVIATERDPRALACARDNVNRLLLGKLIDVVEADLFPEGRAPLIVCNPPWIPARPATPLEGAVYDVESRMLRGFLVGLSAHLTPGGQGWLILSDIAEHLGLRTREDLLAMIAKAGLNVVGKIDIKPRHKRVFDAADPLHSARAAEVTSLWRLAAKG